MRKPCRQARQARGRLNGGRWVAENTYELSIYLQVS